MPLSLFISIVGIIPDFGEQLEETCFEFSENIRSEVMRAEFYMMMLFWLLPERSTATSTPVVISSTYKKIKSSKYR